MAKIDEYAWYRMMHQDEQKKRHIVHNGEKKYVRYAYSPYDAIERVADQYGWGNVHNVWEDADTRGELWCRAEVYWAGETPQYLFAEIAE